MGPARSHCDTLLDGRSTRFQACARGKNSIMVTHSTTLKMDFESIALTTRPRLPLEKTIVRESSAKLECLAAAIPPNGSEERQLHGCLTSAQVILLINQPRTGQETTQQETRLKEKPSNLYKERVHAASSS